MNHGFQFLLEIKFLNSICKVRFPLFRNLILTGSCFFFLFPFLISACNVFELYYKFTMVLFKLCGHHFYTLF
jgi:hypothetical protein